jgi:hypothetical protein
MDFDTSSIPTLSRQVRRGLLTEPLVTTRVTVSGMKAEHRHQLFAAKGMVSADRYGKMEDQMNSQSDRPFKIEFPVKALQAASPAFAAYLEANPGQDRIDVNMGGVLPGFSLQVLDWYVLALNAKSWKNFLPSEPSTEGVDKFFYLYVYLALRRLGMDVFADSFLLVLEELVVEYGLMDEASTAEMVLTQLYFGYSETEGNLYPLVKLVARYYVDMFHLQRMPLSKKDCDTMNAKLPPFGTMMKELLTANEALEGQRNNLAIFLDISLCIYLPLHLSPFASISLCLE